MPETDDFYELCDKYGILVMQEWPTAWNSHNTQPYAMLQETVERNTKRLRNHPSLIMWEQEMNRINHSDLQLI